jgi:hypothetical protein
MGHGFELYTYGPLAVPAGVTLRDASEVIPLAEVFYYDNPRTGSRDLGPFSDLFRFKLLSERGGWWSDVDTICLSAAIPAVERAWAQEYPEIAPEAIGTSQIAMRRNDPLAVELFVRCLALSRTPFPRRESLGPVLLSSTIRDMGLAPNEFGSPETFYPIRWIESFKLWLPHFRDEVEASARGGFFMPIYQSIARYLGLTSAKMPPPGSYLADVCASHLAEAPGTGRYTAEEVVERTRAFIQGNASWAPEELRIVGGEETMAKLGLAREMD